MLPWMGLVVIAICLCCDQENFWKRVLKYIQAFFWTIFRQLNSTGVASFWVFLEFWLEFFSDFAWVLSFFHEFLEIFSEIWKMLIIFYRNVDNFTFLKIFDNKNGVFRGTPSFSSPKWSFLSLWRQLNSTGFAIFWVFSGFCLSFFRILLEFWVFWGLSFFRNVQKKPGISY